ncbi:MAG: imidazole glycerol phosphate synthase subunit HisH [Dehalococcoidia bacterium]|nr:imidazole glycerol phosphate synthase subunit HisH [Dehalococcoidia bacterium]
MIAIIDYGAGNLRSVARAIGKLGYVHEVTADPLVVRQANAVILPGVGAAGDIMRSLLEIAMVDPLREAIEKGRPFLGICLGLQVLLSLSEEGGGEKCLDIISGVVRRLPDGLKVPHMGWNQVKQRVSHPVFYGIPDEADFYFVHSYYADPLDKTVVVGETEYGLTFCSMIARDKMVAVQFHPEKSGELGLKLLDNFLRWSGAEKR